MKLRNKKTGEIVPLSLYGIQVYSRTKEQPIYHSLAELNEEWEDYEDPKEDYIRVIESFIHYAEEADDSFYCDESVKKFIEKLKAWKRLKDKGAEFYGWRKNPTGTYDFLARWKDVPPKMSDIINDLDLLFGGEE